MRPNKKAFTLVEMLVALAVSAVIVSATYASFELIKNQYKKNIDVTQLHTSGRAIMQVLEREIRMAGYEFRDDKGLMTYGKIAGPLVLGDSGNKCCDEVIIIYDEVTDTLNSQGVVTSSIVDRIKTRFWTEAHSSSKRGSRFRLYKRRTILGTNNAVLATPRVGAKEVMADYIEDLQIVDINALKTTNNNDYVKIDKSGAELANSATEWSCVYDKDSGLIWEVKTNIVGKLNYHHDYYTWYDSNPKTNGGDSGRKDNWFKPSQTLQNSEDFLQATNSSALCGYLGWRLPELEELKTIVDSSKKRPSIDTSFFPHSPVNEAVFTATEVLKNQVWGIEFGKNGREGANAKSNVAHIRAVYKIPMTLSPLLGITLTLRTKEKYGENRQVKKKVYHAGNFIFSKNDPYQRDTFSTTVAVRNL
jgi:prepilin-type N-terminal cleavage/methylation domain-containing protein